MRMFFIVLPMLATFLGMISLWVATFVVLFTEGSDATGGWASGSILMSMVGIAFMASYGESQFRNFGIRDED